MPKPGATKALLSKSLDGPAKQMPPSPRKKVEATAPTNYFM
jgi:hypothetical protein